MDLLDSTNADPKDINLNWIKFWYLGDQENLKSDPQTDAEVNLRWLELFFADQRPEAA